VRYLAVLLLAGCASLPDAPTVVNVPIAVPCLDALPEKPRFVTDGELLTMPDAAFVLALAADRLERGKYMALTDALLAGCVK